MLTATSPAPASRTQVRHARTPLTISMKTLHSPAARKNGTLETALKAANNAVGNHHHALPVRIILSAKNKNQIVNTRQKASVAARPAQRTIKGCARKKAVPHQAARSPT